jgi:catechol 2,3-dioxygenase
VSERDPEELEATGAPVTGARIPDDTFMGAVELSVADLARSLVYYREAIGLEVLAEGDGRASLGTGGRELLSLVEEPGARPVQSHSGLFHFALLVPERTDLARWLAHAARDGVQLTGASDHFVSEALYLRDPDHHGIEIYWDRPRQVWEGQVADRLTTMPLDLDDILAELDDATEPFAGLASGTTMGHVHLRVASVPETTAFYRDALGFGLMATLRDQAAFLAAGGYHHHLGANIWESAGRGQAPPGHATLRHFTVVLPDAAALDELAGRLDGVEDSPAGPLVRDPSGNAVVLAAA